jgi:hexulose-6-phosphate isomerase
MTRRDFIGSSAGALAAAHLAGTAAGDEDGRPPWKKAVIWSMLDDKLPPRERMALAKRAGFDGIEMPPAEVAQAEAMKALADEVGVTLHSVIYGGWGAPLSSADPTVIERGLAEVRGALRAAKAYGADTVLLVPAIVNADTRYADAYTRSQANIRKLLPLAEDLHVAIAVENVWNNFLLSPLEFARYVDELGSPYARAYFDVGNVVAFGWSEDWVLTLGKRIRKIHLKDFKRDTREWKNLREGSIDWPKVSAALREVGYDGWFTCELGGGDEAYLKDVAARVNAIFEGR